MTGPEGRPRRSPYTLTIVFPRRFDKENDFASLLRIDAAEYNPWSGFPVRETIRHEFGEDVHAGPGQ